jgi:hypothetical protein
VHALQLAVSYKLELVFYISYLAFLLIKAVNGSVMNTKIRAMLCLQYMQQLTLLSHHGCSFSGCGMEHVAVVFASKGCQYLINGCLQPIGTYITQDVQL